GPGVALGEQDQHLLSSSECNQLFDNLYRANSNLNFIIGTTEKNYQGLAKIMMAYNFGVCADLFGDIPFTEALKGDAATPIFSPNYDNAKTVVYPELEKLLVDGIQLLDAVGFKHPGTDDLIYGGDLDKWKKLASSLLLKLYVRQGADGQAKLAALFSSPDQFITTNEDNALIQFVGTSTSSNPFWTEAKSSALGNYLVATTTSIDYLAGTQDPRIDQFYNKAVSGLHVGLRFGDIEAQPASADFSKPNGAKLPDGGVIFSPTAPVILVSSWEVNLLLAEAVARGWIAGDAKALYDAAVKANFEYLGLDAASADTYLAGKGAYDPANAIKSIALQKWVCMTGLQSVESWIETRRFDNSSNPIFSSPGGIFVTPTKNGLGGNKFPSILPYPETEESLNKNFPGQHGLDAKVFWDN
ncbi:MAG TPA: SusD/RagB family nutrient-binding outer membrane lipoprotein, partial [Saprospiraceae bacterium]|nr:SusD/RagB family nutrient-binding outer membrane lipoprotein [Saprospiraceae bacterium]